MDNKNKIFVFFIICSFLSISSIFLPIHVYSQDSVLQDAVELFNRGQFYEALPIFKNLYEADQENKMISYYYGACLVEEGIFIEETDNTLLNAIAGNTPDKVLYYVGKNFEMKGLWNSALKYYELYAASVSEEDNINLGIEDLIALCREKSNNTLQTQNTNISERNLETENSTNNSDEFQMTEETIIEQTLPDEEQIENDYAPINFQVNNQIYYLKNSHFKNIRAWEIFWQGKNIEERLNKLNKSVDSLRVEYGKTSDLEEKNNISKIILEAEKESLTLKSQSDSLFMEARELENEFWEKASENEINLFLQELQEIESSTSSNDSNEEAFTQSFDPESLQYFNTETTFNTQRTQANKDNTVETDVIVYKIQIGAYSRGLPDYIEKLFNKLSLIRKIDNYTDENGVVVYTTGNLKNYEDALQMQNQVRQEGVSDAFVAAYKNGKRISVQETREQNNE